jgi:hypothetical protein
MTEQGQDALERGCVAARREERVVGFALARQVQVAGLRGVGNCGAPSEPGRSALRSHHTSPQSHGMETQTTQYPFRCPHAACNRRFKRQNGLTQHLRYGRHIPDGSESECDTSDNSDSSIAAAALASPHGDLNFGLGDGIV